MHIKNLRQCAKEKTFPHRLTRICICIRAKEITYGVAVSRINQVARDQDVTALKELKTCCKNHKRVGLRYAKALKNSKVASLKYSSVEAIDPLCTTQCIVKESDTSTVALSS
jgi:hypothetical protein